MFHGMKDGCQAGVGSRWRANSNSSRFGRLNRNSHPTGSGGLRNIQTPVGTPARAVGGAGSLEAAVAALLSSTDDGCTDRRIGARVARKLSSSESTTTLLSGRRFSGGNSSYAPRRAVSSMAGRGVGDCRHEISSRLHAHTRRVARRRDQVAPQLGDVVRKCDSSVHVKAVQGF